MFYYPHSIWNCFRHVYYFFVALKCKSLLYCGFYFKNAKWHCSIHAETCLRFCCFITYSCYYLGLGKETIGNTYLQDINVDLKWMLALELVICGHCIDSGVREITSIFEHTQNRVLPRASYRLRWMKRMQFYKFSSGLSLSCLMFSKGHFQFEN